MSIITDLAQQAKKAAQTLAILDEAKKNAVLKGMAAAIREKRFMFISYCTGPLGRPHIGEHIVF